MSTTDPYQLIIHQFIKKAIKNAPPTTEEMKAAYKAAENYMMYGVLPEGFTDDRLS